jgi:hypothetical protein
MRRLALLSLIVAPLACSEDTTNTGGVETDGASDSGATSTGGGGTQGESGDASAEGTTTGADGSSSGAGDDAAELPPPPATGIQIVDVTADQGLRIPIATNGELIGGSQRNAAILQDRPALIRAFYEVDPGYEAREVYATLYVEQTDGRVTEYGNFVTALDKDCGDQSLIDCRYATLPNSLFWRVDAEDMQPGASYRIEIVEAKPGHENDVSDKVPYFPTDGSSTMVFGVEQSYLKMRVVLVPFAHTIAADCPEAPDLEEEYGTDVDGNPRTVADFFAERLLAQNPVDEVEVIVHPTENFQGSLQGTQLLGRLQEMRFAENAPPEYFYYGVARPCDGGPDFAGVAQIGGPTVGDAAQRVGWGVFYGNTGTTAETFVHEIGHEQGRAHIACNGEEGGPDPSYPGHPDGDLLSYGSDVFGTQLKVHKPSDHDYMTYCSSTWVSAWGWAKVLPWIAEMSSWELGDKAAEIEASKQRLLVGTVRADGTEDWYVTEGWFPAHRASADSKVRLGGLGVGSLELPTVWEPWEKSDDYNVIAALPDAFELATEFTWVTGITEHAIDRTAIRYVGPSSLATPD